MDMEARIATLAASPLLEAIAQSWEQRFPTRYDAMSGEIALDQVQLVMTADGDSLTLRLTGADPSAVEEARLMVEARVNHVAQDEGPFTYPWLIL